MLSTNAIEFGILQNLAPLSVIYGTDKFTIDAAQKRIRLWSDVSVPCEVLKPSLTKEQRSMVEELLRQTKLQADVLSSAFNQVRDGGVPQDDITKYLAELAGVPIPALPFAHEWDFQRWARKTVLPMEITDWNPRERCYGLNDLNLQL